MNETLIYLKKTIRSLGLTRIEKRGLRISFFLFVFLLLWSPAKAKVDTSRNVYIDTSTHQTVISEDKSKKTIILRVEDLPDRNNFLGEKLTGGYFSSLSLSPDRTKIALLVGQGGDLDPGWAGIYDLKTKKIIALKVTNPFEVTWLKDPNKVSVTRYISPADTKIELLIFDVTTGRNLHAESMQVP